MTDFTETAPNQSDILFESLQIESPPTHPSETEPLTTSAFHPVQALANFLIHRQERLGRYGEPFTLYKFRTMKYDAHSSQDEYQKDARGKVMNDDRYTLIGKWLKRRRIDEIPQLFNVAKGEMTLIGPRPHSRKFYDRYVPITVAEKRMQVKPGILKPLMAFSDYDEGDLEFRCDERYLKDYHQRRRFITARYLVRALAPSRFKWVLDPNLPRYNKKDFFTPRLPKDSAA